MIKVEVKKDVNEIKVTGHANFDDCGKDIVCASVSTLIITTVNAIERINKDAIFYSENPFILKVLKKDEVVEKLIDNMLALLKELEHDYPNNIRFL